jgi:hypoxanthine phosphoribosyltransferase
MFPEVERVLIDRGRIAARVQEIADQLSTDLTEQIKGEEHPRIVLVPILTGSIVFLADLIRHMPMKLSIEVVAVSSYPGRTMRSKGAKIRSELPDNLAGTHVLVIDDILDSGETMAVVKRLIGEQNPASLRLCVLLEKEMPDAADRVKADYVGFTIPDEFVVGYGLDYNGFYRNHPDVVTLRGDVT